MKCGLQLRYPRTLSLEKEPRAIIVQCTIHKRGLDVSGATRVLSIIGATTGLLLV